MNKEINKRSRRVRVGMSEFVSGTLFGLWTHQPMATEGRRHLYFCSNDNSSLRLVKKIPLSFSECSQQG